MAEVVAHVTNGDVAAACLRGLGLPGVVIPWRDVLHDGPVPAGPPDALRAVRARFLAERGWTTEAEALASLVERDDQLARVAASDGEIVLWFEPDLYDQLQLLQVLDRVADRAGAVTLVAPAAYLSEVPLGPLFPGRVALGAEARRVGRDAWQAFTGDDPRALHALVARVPAALPWLGPALLRWEEEFPGPDGLARSERQLLAALAAGPVPLRDAFRAAAAADEWRYLGDASFACCVERLAEPPGLLGLADGMPADGPATTAPAWWARAARLTPLGEAVLGGAADAVSDRGIDRWLGGVRLAGRSVPWRWDPQGATVMLSAK